MIFVSRKLVNNHTFFQHPDLIRILRIHENVMAVMINTLGRRSQAQSDASSPQVEGEIAPKGKVCSLLAINTISSSINLFSSLCYRIPPMKW